jgi:hypothetical protein
MTESGFSESGFSESGFSRTARAVLPILDRLAARAETITYADLAREAGVQPPHSIHKTAEALEEILRADHATGRPLRAAVAVSAKRGGIPAPGFFQLAREIGLYFGPDSGPQAEAFHALELQRLTTQP